MTKEVLIGCYDEFEGGFIGTVNQVLEWQNENNVPFNRPRYFHVSSEIDIVKILENKILEDSYD